MQPIMQLLDSDPVVRRDAARALCRRGDPSSVPNILLALESETEGEVRFRLVEALGAIGDRRALPALIAGLEDHSEHVRERAALALGVLGEVTGRLATCRHIQ